MNGQCCQVPLVPFRDVLKFKAEAICKPRVECCAGGIAAAKHRSRPAGGVVCF